VQRGWQWQWCAQAHHCHLLFCCNAVAWRGRQHGNFPTSFILFYCCSSMHNVKRRTMTMMCSSTSSLSVVLLQHSCTKRKTMREHSHVIIFFKNCKLVQRGGWWWWHARVCHRLLLFCCNGIAQRGRWHKSIFVLSFFNVTLT
jgi:hypothetical protein